MRSILLHRFFVAIDALRVEEVGHFFETKANTRFDSTEWGAGLVGDLVVAEAVKKGETDADALFSRQLGEGGL